MPISWQVTATRTVGSRTTNRYALKKVKSTSNNYIESSLKYFTASGAADADDLASDSDDESRDIFVNTPAKGGRGRKKAVDENAEAVTGPFLTFTTHAYQRPATHRCVGDLL